MVKFLPLQVNTIGDLYTISNKLPSFHLPQMSFETIRLALPDAFTIAVLAAIESLLSCVVADGMINGRHRSNMELAAQGAGNIASALFGGIPATGAIARTAANVKNGGRTPVAGMVHALVLALILVIFMPYAAMIPMPAIAAILFMVAYNMCQWRTFADLLKTAPKSDIAVLILTFFLTILFDLVVAIEIGILVAVLLFMKRMSDVAEVRSWKYAEDEEEAEHEHEDEHEHEEGGGYDPHVWLSPLNAKREMENIKNAMAEADPANAEYYEANYAAWSARCDQLDQAFKDGLSNLAIQDIVVSHEAFGYLCDAYGLNQVGIEGISPDSEPDPARMAQIQDFVTEHQVKVIFSEELVSPKVAQAIADATGARVETLSPLEGLTDEQLTAGEDYFSVMEQSLASLKDALS